MADHALATAVAALTYPELEGRRDEINVRLAELGSEDASKKKPGTKRPRDDGGGIPYDAKIDTHWDFLMKEMMWLGADFMGERKRQHALAKKQANGVKQFHKSKETRRIRLLADAELKRRRLSAKIGREVRGWWTKIERVIAYKQKLSADKERRKAMNKQLVELVRLTERYGEKVSQSGSTDHHASLTIEEALAAADRLRRKAPRDYANIDLTENCFYGESTTEESGSDGSYVLDSEEDDETTLREAEAEETQERLKARGVDIEDNGDAYVADLDELQKLQEESNMKIYDVLARVRDEGQNGDDSGIEDNGVTEDDQEARGKHVTFAEDVADTSVKPNPRRVRSPVRMQHPAGVPSDQGFEADDDGDASDVEDFDSNENADLSDGSDEFQANENEVDDETTIAAEERLGRDISVEEEINLLRQEGEMSIEELRRRYALMEERAAASVEEEESEGSAENINDMDSKLVSPVVTKASDVEAMFNEDDAGEEDEFHPAHEVDDETTLEAEERLGRDMSYEEEIAILQKENEMSVDELRKMYLAMEGNDKDDKQEDGDEDVDDYPDDDDMFSRRYDSDDGEDEFHPEDEAVDDETTMEAEEKMARDMSVEDEIALLKRESETPIEELRALYATASTTVDSASRISNSASNGNGKRRRIDKEEEDDDDGIEALKALRESEDRARATVATRPFLLSTWVKLRNYQQTGLNWLVSTQSRRLNGIL